LKEGKISAGHAKVLVGLSDKEQAKLVDSIVGQKLSVRDVEAMTKSMKNGTNTPEAKSMQKESLDFDALKACFDGLGIKTRTKSNEITLFFNGDEEIEKLLNQLD